VDLVHSRAVAPHRNAVVTPMLASDARDFIVDLTGLDPDDPELWLEALTHGSTGQARNYERLEFLGDRVLGLVIAAWLHELGTGDEGKLSLRLNALVSRSTCASVARHIGLAEHIVLGKQARDDGARDSDNVLGDVLEALLGACFVAYGFDAASILVRNLWGDCITGGAGSTKHPKSALQEWAAMNKRKLPQYSLIDRSGPDHAVHFTVSVQVSGIGKAEGTGLSKQEAETAAAEVFLARYA
jgi:ribonuclease III